MAKNSETARKMRRVLRQISFVKAWNKRICEKKMDAVRYGEETGDYSRYWAMMPKIMK